jgi:pimeloyl-ACP methyl ester carboxylesterase
MPTEGTRTGGTRTGDIIEGRVEANGVDFAYLEAGRGPLALCLHGFPDTAWGWRPLLSALADAGFRGVAPFMRGYAPTAIPHDGRYQSGVLAADANALHDALGGGGDAVVIGHDWGAMAAYGAVGHEPDRWRRAVAASVPPAAALGASLLDYDVIKHRTWYQFFFCNPLADLAVPMDDLAFIDRLWADWSPGYDGAAEVARVKDALREPGRITAALGYYRQTLGAAPQDPALADVQALTFAVPPRPTLYLHGLDDGCMPCPALAVAEAAFATEGSRVELIEGAGHFLQYERPDVVAAAIVDFVAR